MPALTPAQRRVLLNLHHGNAPWGHLHGAAARGGARHTARALTARGLIDAAGNLTDAGRALAERMPTVTTADPFPTLCESVGLPRPEPEYRFAPPRRWRLDYAFVEQRLALEVEGGIWVNGRHNRASGWMRDKEKYNALAVMGWRLLRVTPQEMSSGSALGLVMQALEKP